MTVSCKVENSSEEEDTRAWQLPMKTSTLILPLKVTTNINRSDSSGVTVGLIAGATAGVTAGALID